MISRYLVVVFLFLILEPKLYFRSIDSDDSLSLSLSLSLNWVMVIVNVKLGLILGFA